MRVFLTGATGFIGSALIPELIAHGHQVLGLTRSEQGVQALRAAGAEPHRGELENLDSLRSGAAHVDAVIHAAFNHHFSDFAEYIASCEQDRRAVEALGDALAGSGRPLIVTSGTGMGKTAPGELAAETDLPDPADPIPRVASELAADAVAARGVPVAVIRLAQIHDTCKQGLVTYVVATAREKGVSAYVGDGCNRWPAAHVSDTARLYRLVLEHLTREGAQGRTAARYNAVAEEGVPVRAIAEAVGRGLKVPTVSLAPEEAGPHFGWIAGFVGRDIPASSALTQQRLGWRPTGPGLLEDLGNMRYDQA